MGTAQFIAYQCTTKVHFYLKHNTVGQPLIDPNLLLRYFDSNTQKLKEGLELDFQEIYDLCETIPVSHMTHVDKLFQLHENVGVAISGLVSIGDRTLKSIVEEVMSTKYKACRKAAITLKEKIWEHYEERYKDSYEKPPIELLVSGWNKGVNHPLIYRINFPDNKILKTLEGNYGISLGGQYKEIARLVHGTDAYNKYLIELRFKALLQYLLDETERLNPEGVSWPDEDFLENFAMFGLENPNDSESREWGLNGFETSVGDFSDQNAINCVGWLIELMIRSQEFSNSMPTVGGDIHIAIINRQDGFRFVSEESYRFRDHTIPKNQKEITNANANGETRDGGELVSKFGTSDTASKDVS